jgi:NADH-quinone oxidoreductase E subunit
METKEFKFNEEELKEVEKYISKYPDKRAAVIPVLWMAQRKFRHVPKPMMEYIAELLDQTYSHIYGVVTFYTMFSQKPRGKYHLQVCTNVSCMLREGDKIYQMISQKLDLKNNEATSDGNFSLEEAECMGACSGAPMMAINEDFYENLDINKIDQLIDSLK